MNGKLGRACLTVLIGALIGVSAVACGGDDEAAPKPKFSSSSAVPTANISSPAVKSTSAAPSISAGEFVRAWNAASTKMQNTGDTAFYRSISRGCEACNKTADLVEKYYGAGGYVRTDGWRIRKLKCKEAADDSASCVAQLDVGRTEYSESSAGAEQNFAGGTSAEYFEASSANGSWNMTYIAEQAR